jgi:hypothetical protein
VFNQEAQRLRMQDHAIVIRKARKSMSVFPSRKPLRDGRRRRTAVSSPARLETVSTRTFRGGYGAVFCETGLCFSVCPSTPSPLSSTRRRILEPTQPRVWAPFCGAGTLSLGQI